MRSGARLLKRAASALVATAPLLLGGSCNYGEVVVVRPAAAGHGPLILSIQADPEDTAVARRLGWARGIPGAEVTVSPGEADTATGPAIAVLQTDSLGSASVPDLPDGTYLVEVRRLLSAAEAARLAPTEDVTGFFAKAVVKRGPVTLPAPASRRRSVVISEWAFNTEWIPESGLDYELGGVLELANNSDTTIYLDGLVVGDAFAWPYDYSEFPCKSVESLTLDPEGLWSRYFDSLPGTGHTHPLAPGATAVIALDAIDHSALAPTGLDLSHADFEFIGEADVDNPGVPNTVPIGLAPYPHHGHGLLLSHGIFEVVFLALRLDVATLPRQVYPVTGNTYARVPGERILDVVSLLIPRDFRQTPCPQLVHRTFDRYRARMIHNNYQVGPVLSVIRKVALTRRDGRKILQHTRTSNAHFFVGPRTPGWLP